jgi:hypothetical protein
MVENPTPGRPAYDRDHPDAPVPPDENARQARARQAAEALAVGAAASALNMKYDAGFRARLGRGEAPWT